MITSQGLHSSQDLAIKVDRLGCRLSGDSSKTILRFFWLGEGRAHNIFERINKLNDFEVDRLTANTLMEFVARHSNLTEILSENFYRVTSKLGIDSSHMTPARQLLIGSYFTMEYAYESTALFNPSMVPSRDQSNLKPGETRFLMSLRAVGEGHISSIVFREGIISAQGEIMVEPASQNAQRLQRIENRVFNKFTFKDRLGDTGLYDPCVEKILDQLNEEFTCEELIKIADVEKLQCKNDLKHNKKIDRVIWLARSNYQILSSVQSNISEFVIFPISPQESQGMEDMRLVLFAEDDGGSSYCGTYTAFNGSRILPQLLISSTRSRADIYSLHGKFAKNKGLALFPRTINGKYMMIGRVDGENLYLLRSENIFEWNEGQIIQRPKQPWEFVQIGNCGSPIETKAGWLVLTHGVGAMRRYSIGAILLDLNDPSKILGELREPFLTPIKEERIGYVPNVVYSCGAMIHSDKLIVPYGISDAATGFATLELDDLLNALT